MSAEVAAATSGKVVQLVESLDLGQPPSSISFTRSMTEFCAVDEGRKEYRVG